MLVMSALYAEDRGWDRRMTHSSPAGEEQWSLTKQLALRDGLVDKNSCYVNTKTRVQILSTHVKKSGAAACTCNLSTVGHSQGQGEDYWGWCQLASWFRETLKGIRWRMTETCSPLASVSTRMACIPAHTCLIDHACMHACDVPMHRQRPSSLNLYD